MRLRFKNNFTIPSRIRKRVSAREFLSLCTAQRNSIEKVRFVPPVIGKRRDFGSFEVEFKYELKAK